MPFFSKLLKEESKDWFFDKIPPDQTPNDIPIKKIDKESEYLSIILKSMRIVKVRFGFSKYFATVNSYISLSHPSGNRASFCVCTTPGQLEKLDKSNINRVIIANKKLLGPVPYIGGDIDIELGLFSIKSADLLKPLVSLLGEISNLAGVAFVKAAEPYFKPLDAGINLLLNTSNPTILQAGISYSFINSIETGYYVIMRVPKGEMTKQDLIIDEQDFKLLDKQRKPIIKYPYLVFQVIFNSKRDDWREIPDIKLAHEKLKSEARTGKQESTEDAFTLFKRTVQFSDDMIETDKDSVISDVMDELKKKLGAITLTAAPREIILRDLSEIDIYAGK